MGEQIIVVIMMVWVLCGIMGMLIDKFETYDINVPFIIFFTIAPCFPLIFHACGLF